MGRIDYGVGASSFGRKGLSLFGPPCGPSVFIDVSRLSRSYPGRACVGISFPKHKRKVGWGQAQSFCNTMPATMKITPIIVEKRIFSPTAKEIITREKKGTK